MLSYTAVMSPVCPGSALTITLLIYNKFKSYSARTKKEKEYPISVKNTHNVNLTWVFGEKNMKILKSENFPFSHFISKINDLDAPMVI